MSEPTHTTDTTDTTDVDARATPTFVVAIDCEAPHQLARFWAAALHYEVEDNHEQILQMIDLGFATRKDAVEIDGRLAWGTACAANDPAGQRSRLLFQQVPEPKTSKNRVHLDLHIGTADRAAEVARLVALGARQLWVGELGPQSWVTMADPEGNEFCVS